MKIQTREIERGVWEVSILGKLTIDQADLLEKSLEPLFSAGVTGVRLDMSGLDFMDSPGLGQLIKAANMAKSAGINLTLHRLPDGILNILTSARVGAFFSIVQDNETRQK